MAGLIGVIGNLAVNLAFSYPIIGGNLWWMILALLLVGLIIMSYLLFLPKIKMIFRFLPKYLDFPNDYEKYVDEKTCETNARSTMILQFERLKETITDFSSTVKLAILMNVLLKAVEKTSSIRISAIKLSEDFIPFVQIEISIKGFIPWFKPMSSKKIQSDLVVLAQALMNAHQLCSVRAFELNIEQWEIHGSDFVNTVSDWNFKDIQKMIVDAIKVQKIDKLTKPTEKSCYNAIAFILENL
jgi:hypothetical protein